MPVHENRYGTNQNVGYILAGGRIEHIDSEPALKTVDELRDIA
jgi:hypothetical protein